MSHKNAEPVRRFVAGVVCAGAFLASVTPADAAFPGRNGRIAFSDPDRGIFSVWPNGVGEHRLVRRGGGAVYSPRGDRILVTREYRLDSDAPGIGFFTVNRIELFAANGSRRGVLTGGDDYFPAWAPDGERIVFARADPCDK